MPKHITEHGKTIGYHPIVIRFTTDQMDGLKAMSSQAGKAVNELVRNIVEKQLELFRMSQNSA